MQIRDWDMYEYILESRAAVRNIVENQEDIFSSVLAYLKGKQVDQIYVLGSGTSYHAAASVKKLMEDVLGIQIIHMFPMEFVDNETVFNKHTLIIGVSHAGRSSSTIAALDKARAQGFMTIAMTAEKNRPLPSHADSTVYIEIGEEHAGPKTKGFIGSIATIALFGLKLAVQNRTITEEKKQEYERRMLAVSDNIPDIASKAWDWYKANARELKQCRRLIIIGYEACMGAMLEGTLKILEAVRYSVTGYELEEFMHGVYHSIDQDTYMLYLGCPGKHYSRLIRMMGYFDKEREAHNYLITSDKEQAGAASFVYPFSNDKYFATMEYVVPLQVLARKLSLDLGIDCNESSDPDFHKKMGSYTY